MNLCIEHPNLGDKCLWKYLDIHKFLYFLNEKKIYFTRSDRFEDPNECLPESIIRRIYECESFPDEENLNPNLFSDKKKAIFQNTKQLESLKTTAESIQKRQYINCWFIGESESYSMWNIYSTPESVAIKFESAILIENLNKSIQNITSDSWIKEIFCGLVDYQKVYPPEYDASIYIPPKNRYSALKKDISYSAENEFRFVAFSKKIYPDKYKFELEIKNLHDLDFYIIAHPKMETWIFNNFKSILRTSGLEKRLIKSGIKLKSKL